MTIIVAPLFWAWNLVTADGAAFLGHWWNYIETYGPAMKTVEGRLPLLFPVLPFALYAVLTLGIVDAVDDQGQRWFERVMRLPAVGRGWRHEARRALTWALSMNVFYAAFFTVPMIAVRLLFPGDSPIVP